MFWRVLPLRFPAGAHLHSAPSGALASRHPLLLSSSRGGKGNEDGPERAWPSLPFAKLNFNLNCGIN
jgi:hypothetical protein